MDSLDVGGSPERELELNSGHCGGRLTQVKLRLYYMGSERARRYKS
jgi:hypothetical protein